MRWVFGELCEEKSMIKFFKKNRICTVFLLIISVYYLSYGRYLKDGGDRRWYLINLAEKSEKIIEYKTSSNIKHSKCFVLSFEINSFKENIGDFGDLFYPRKYNPYTLTDEQFYSYLIKGKPHFSIKIFKNEALVENKEIYITTSLSSSFEEIDGKEIDLYVSFGHFKPRTSACYHFEENSFYKIVVTNNIPLSQYQDVITFLGIIPILNK